MAINEKRQEWELTRMFTSQELETIAVLLQRVDLKGNEAITVANLQIKIQQRLQENPPVEEPKNDIKDKK